MTLHICWTLCCEFLHRSLHGDSCWRWNYCLHLLFCGFCHWRCLCFQMRWCAVLSKIPWGFWYWWGWLLESFFSSRFPSSPALRHRVRGNRCWWSPSAFRSPSTSPSPTLSPSPFTSLFTLPPPSSSFPQRFPSSPTTSSWWFAGTPAPTYKLHRFPPSRSLPRSRWTCIAQS